MSLPPDDRFEDLVRRARRHLPDLPAAGEGNPLAVAIRDLLGVPGVFAQPVEPAELLAAAFEAYFAARRVEEALAPQPQALAPDPDNAERAALIAEATELRDRTVDLFRRLGDDDAIAVIFGFAGGAGGSVAALHEVVRLDIRSNLRIAIDALHLAREVLVSATGASPVAGLRAVAEAFVAQAAFRWETLGGTPAVTADGLRADPFLSFVEAARLAMARAAGLTLPPLDGIVAARRRRTAAGAPPADPTPRPAPEAPADRFPDFGDPGAAFPVHALRPGR